MNTLSILGNITAAEFLSTYWHKKPLLIRNAIPNFTPIFSRDALFDLASEDDVESRLLTYQQDKWEMASGPFEELPPLTQKQWTLLLQGANYYSDEAADLLNAFRFLPDARLDDLMISFATDGGGVGPHFDSYDVFLLQAQGERRWRISAQEDLSLVEGLPLKILQNFAPTEEFILGPGDMLYLPPQYAHDGVAVGECMTYSIGFRAPAYQELGEEFLQFMVESIDLPGMYADPDLAPTDKPAEISSDMIQRIAHELNKVRFTEEDISVFLGQYLSEPKNNVFFEPVAKPLSAAKFAQAAERRGIALSRKSRMLYHDTNLFVNGEPLSMPASDAAILSTLANTKQLDGKQLASCSEDAKETFYQWYQDGWIVLKRP
jgi:50S ribosomal protein L16 3-hydroxylase